jgi:GAF domain-containing protein
MAAPNSLRGVVVVAHGSDLSGVEDALTDAGIVLSSHPAGDQTVHLVPYGDSLAVIIDPDAPPIEWLGYPLNPQWMLTAIRTARELLLAQRAVRESHVLLGICRAMASERDRSKLQRFVLRKARELTNADAGSLYLIETIEGERGLRFAVAQTGPRDEEKYHGQLTPLTGSIAGWVAVNGKPLRIADAYETLPAGVTFDASFDRATGYRTKSVLCAPIRNHHDDVVGVLQLINRKATFDAALSLDVLSEEVVMPFDEHDEEILTALAAQAGVALEAV